MQRILTSPLSIKLIYRIILISLLITIISALVQIALDYNRGLDSIEETLNLIEETDLESIAASVYNIDEAILNIQLRGIIKMESIVFVQVREIRGENVYLSSVGDELVEQHIVRVLPLIHHSPGGEEREFGSLLVAANLDNLYNRLFRSALGIFLENMIIISCLAIVLFFMTEMTITRHLAKIADYANKVDLNRLDQTLILDRKDSIGSVDDELAILTKSFNDMQKRIFDEIMENRKNQEERERLEEHYKQTQKMESIGRLAGGVAHDLNNLLTPILLCGDFLDSQTEEGDPDKEYINGILEAGTKARDLVAQLLTFSRKAPLEYKVLDVNTLISHFEKLLRRTIRENIKITMNLNEGLFPVYADRGQLEQIILNLSVNAQDAMVDGGTLSIETRNIYLDSSYAEENPDVTPGNYVMLAICDTGAGIPKEVRSKIFDPFFSTKGDMGTGLGLSTVYGIIKQHKGTVWVYSEENVGTCFKVYLPEYESSGGAAEAEREDQILPAAEGHEYILVVEDNKQVRELTVKILLEQSYKVLSAENSIEALKILTNKENTVDLLLSDVILPGLNGKELYDNAKQIRPDLKVLYMSGYTDNIISFTEESADHFIQKPFSRMDLIRKIRSLLD
ncbi:MAG: ATP-binding protein [Spirochaetales bacterium]|nr:ATP-binding protein [Spirochaetales bacterium]